MEEKQNQKNCNNCRYFIRHYVKTNCGFIEICDGHCINDRYYKTNFRKNFTVRQNCQFWETEEIKKQERKKTIDTVIRDMQTRLARIEELLNADVNK